MKTVEIEFDFLGEKHKARFWKNSYANNGSLYIGVLTWDEDYEEWESWSDLTVNLPGMCHEGNLAFVNMECSGKEIITILEAAGFVKNTGVTRSSGYCVYPLYEFTQEFLDSLEEE